MSEPQQFDRPVAEIGSTRLAVGLTQGVVLFILQGTAEAHVWPATEGWLFAGLLCVVLFMPLTILAGLSGMRPATLAVWTLMAGSAVAAIAVYNVLREPASAQASPSFVLFPVVAAGLFVAYHLVAAADAERKFVAGYRTYFDIAWKNGVQLVLSGAFLGAFWLLLFLGTALFGLIEIEILGEVIREEWFAYSASAVVFAAAVHLTDVRVGLINGTRAVALVLLSWLLPVMTAMAIAFLAMLPLAGIELLWATRSATFLLLTAAGALVVLINAAYQDGSPDAPPHVVLRIAARAAALALVPLVAISAYAIWLRVDQHGLTTDRVIVIACVAVAACYAAGYSIAAIWPGRWMKPLESVNIISALVALGLTIGLMTPIGDPARIAVDDQLRRLAQRTISPEQFDFNFLRFNAARFGIEALERLKADKSSERARAIGRNAGEALTRDPARPQNFSPQQLMAKITVYPAGSALPPSFLAQDWSGVVPSPLSCVREAGTQPCEAFLADFDGDGRAEILLSGSYRIDVFELSQDSAVWTRLGYLDASQCPGLVSGLKAGTYKLVAPSHRDLEIGGKRVQLVRPCA